MPTNDNREPERRLGPYLLGGDERKAGADSAKSFTTPEPTEEQNKRKQAEFAAEYQKSLEWMRFVEDPVILKSKERDLLKTYLDALLEGLRQRYAEGNSARFPSTSELNRLTQVVTKLATQVGIRRTGFGDLLSAMKRVENRWNKLRLLSFADDLLARLLRVPMCPLSVVHYAWSGCSDTGRRQVLREVKLILAGAVEAGVTAIPWDQVFTEIERLAFPTAALKAGEVRLVIEACADSNQKHRVCYLLMMDLSRQQLEWNEKYAKQVAPALQWIYLLQRQADFVKLSARYCGDVLAPDRVAEELRRQAGRDRRNESYRKHVARPRKNVRVAARKFRKPGKPRRKHR